MIEFILSAPFVLSVIFIIAISMAILLEFEREGWATTFFSIGIALTLWAYKIEIWDVVSTNPWPTIYFSLSYVVAGIIWSFVKWKNYIGSKIDLFTEYKQNFIKENGDINSNWKKWTEFLYNHKNTLGASSYFEVKDTPETIAEKILPKANDKKSLIVSWISYWPMSLSATLLNNPFRKFFYWIFSLVSGIYDKIGNAAAKKMMVGIERPADAEEVNKRKKEILTS